jgi:hypothetical protein
VATSLTGRPSFNPDATGIHRCHQIAILLNLRHDFLTTVSRTKRTFAKGPLSRSNVGRASIDVAARHTSGRPCQSPGRIRPVS